MITMRKSMRHCLAVVFLYALVGVSSSVQAVSSDQLAQKEKIVEQLQLRSLAGNWSTSLFKNVIGSSGLSHDQKKMFDLLVQSITEKLIAASADADNFIECTNQENVRLKNFIDQVESLDQDSKHALRMAIDREVADLIKQVEAVHPKGWWVSRSTLTKVAIITLVVTGIAVGTYVICDKFGKSALSTTSSATDSNNKSAPAANQAQPAQPAQAVVPAAQQNPAGNAAQAGKAIAVLRNVLLKLFLIQNSNGSNGGHFVLTNPSEPQIDINKLGVA